MAAGVFGNVCVCERGGGCIHQTETVGQYWGMENQQRYFKGEAYAQTSQRAVCRAAAFPEARIAISHLLH